MGLISDSDKERGFKDGERDARSGKPAAINAIDELGTCISPSFADYVQGYKPGYEKGESSGGSGGGGGRAESASGSSASASSVAGSGGGGGGASGGGAGGGVALLVVLALCVIFFRSLFYREEEKTVPVSPRVDPPPVSVPAPVLAEFARARSALSKVWRGTWVSGSGFVFEGEMHLRLSPSDAVDGWIDYTYRKVPSEMARAFIKEGSTGKEPINGHFDPKSRTLDLVGHRTFVTVNYHFTLSDDLAFLNGTANDVGKSATFNLTSADVEPSGGKAKSDPAPAGPEGPTALADERERMAIGKLWVGTWTAPNGYVGDAEMRLRLSPSDAVEGAIYWRCRVTPYGWLPPRVGDTGTEYVRGTFNASTRALNVEGYAKDDPKRVLGLDKYKLTLSEDLRRLEGVTWNHGDWAATLKLTAKGSLKVEPEPSKTILDDAHRSERVVTGTVLIKNARPIGIYVRVCVDSSDYNSSHAKTWPVGSSSIEVTAEAGKRVINVYGGGSPFGGFGAPGVAVPALVQSFWVEVRPGRRTVISMRK
ncbi:MAG: hypothetical protein U0793_20100 [Gemmataceae bacterium]